MDETGEDPKISSRPNALVLFNPVMALAPYEGARAADAQPLWGLAQRIGADPRSVSPAHHVKKGAPPTLMFFGTQDRLLSGAQYFQKKMKEVGSRCELVTYDGQQHGFFNYGRGTNKFFRDTMEQADKFLSSLGYLSGEPTIDKCLETTEKG